MSYKSFTLELDKKWQKGSEPFWLLRPCRVSNPEGLVDLGSRVAIFWVNQSIHDYYRSTRTLSRAPPRY
jgi:hypothetical protein